MDAIAVPRQPNFETISGSFNALSEQFALYSNLPAVDGGARLMLMIEVIMQRLTAIDERFAGIDERFNTLEQTMRRGFSDMDRKMTVLNKNFSARMQNSIVVHEGVDLVPLCSVLTGEEIANCPATLGDLDRLSPQEAAELLHQLGEPVPRGVEQRRRQLRYAFGVRTRVV